MCVGGRSLSRHDDRRFALRVLDTIFGGTSSSRLFQEVRERYGLAYSVYSFTSAYQDSGQIGLYVGTRADNLPEAMRVVDGELARLRTEPATAEELARAKENLKGRVLLALESTGARMSRLGSEILAEAPLLSLDEVVERIDAVSLDDLEELATELWDPRGCRSRARPRRTALDEARSFGRSSPGAQLCGHVAAESPLDGGPLHDPGRGQRRRRAHGVHDVRGGRSRRRHGAGRADRSAAGGRARRCAARRAPGRVVDFSVPSTAVENIRTAVAAGVHVVVGTTGFDADEVRGLEGANVFIAPNFAIGAVLMMTFAAQATKHMRAAEIIELHHDRKVDAPERHGRADRRADA